MERRITLLTKQDVWSQHCVTLARIFGTVVAHMGRRGDPWPEIDLDPQDYLISFLSPWIVPPAILEIPALAINFHCGSTMYPGIGSYNFALYEGASEFGTICHHMARRVDTGPIIEERRFPILPDDTVETLKFRTMVEMLAQFHRILLRLSKGSLESWGEVKAWERPPFTRQELNALAMVRPEMESEEIRRRVRALTYPTAPGATLEFGGVQWQTAVPQRPPIA